MPSRRRSPPARTFTALLLSLVRPVLFWLAARQRRRTGRARLKPALREAPEARPDPAVRALQSTPELLHAMQAGLRAVLDADESHRRVYRHLDRFERKFAKYGLLTIERLPVDQLGRGLAEFEALVRNWSSPNLADLRSRMAVVLADRSSAASVWIAGNSVHGAQRHGPGTAAIGSTRIRSPSNAAGGADRRPSVRASGGRHVGMSRFEWGDGGFHSTSAPA